MRKNNALDLLFETELRHHHKAEKEIFENLKTLAEQALSVELRECFLRHREETQKQIGRLEEACHLVGIDLRASKLQGLPGLAEKGKELIKAMADLNFTNRSKGVDGIMNEEKELLRHFADTDANDLALFIAAQKVEHFEIACYKSLCLIAETVGRGDVAILLTESLNEEIKMGERLLSFADSHFLSAAS